jgi:hypothetical protein
MLLLSAVGCVVGLLLLRHVVNEAMIRVFKQISRSWIAEICAEICAKQFSDPNLELTRLVTTRQRRSKQLRTKDCCGSWELLVFHRRQIVTLKHFVVSGTRGIGVKTT